MSEKEVEMTQDMTGWLCGMVEAVAFFPDAEKLEYLEQKIDGRIVSCDWSRSVLKSWKMSHQEWKRRVGTIPPRCGERYHVTLRLRFEIEIEGAE